MHLSPEVFPCTTSDISEPEGVVGWEKGREWIDASMPTRVYFLDGGLIFVLTEIYILVTPEAEVLHVWVQSDIADFCGSKDS